MELLQERMAIGDIAVGEVAVTPAFKLDAKYIIHTVEPAWYDGKYGAFEKLYSCYEKSLNKAKELNCESIAFPLIATGVYGFPKDEALQIAIRAISKFLLDNDMNVTLVVFDRKFFELSGLYEAEECVKASAPMPSDLDDIMENLGETFQERLLRLVDEKGVSDVEVYKKANIDRKLFSKIRCNADYKPKRKTAVALAIALELDLQMIR